MHKIDSLTGSQLMRLWGVPSFPHVGGSYYLWNGVAVFVVIERGGYVELHMAMKKGERHKCRDAGADIISLIGNREIWAQIKIEHKQVCNLAKRFGFVETNKGYVRYVDGTSGIMITMKRHAK